MGNLIARSASVERIREVLGKTAKAAAARGGEVAALAQARLQPVLTALEASEQQFAQAQEKDDILQANLLARDSESDLEIATVLDEIHHALGRPAQSIAYDLIVSGGKKTGSVGDPARQPYLVDLLAGNIRSSTHPRLADKKEIWAARIEQKAAARVAAGQAARACYAQVAVLLLQRRSLADNAQLELTRFKRDLKDLGMSETQAHEIIPDTPPGKAAPAQQPSSPPTAPSAGSYR